MLRQQAGREGGSCKPNWNRSRDTMFYHYELIVFCAVRCVCVHAQLKILLCKCYVEKRMQCHRSLKKNDVVLHSLAVSTKPHWISQSFILGPVAPSFIIVLTLVAQETPTVDSVYPRPTPVISSDPRRGLRMRHGKS